jgi:hypothetical protein
MDEAPQSFKNNLSLDNEVGITLSQFLDLFIEDMYLKLDDIFIKESEKKIADAVLTVFKTRHDLEIFKKKALYIYIREMTDCETPHLTKVVNVLKQEFYKDYNTLYEKGFIKNNLP